MSDPSFVRENIEDLQQLINRFRNRPQEKRLRLLLLLKSTPWRTPGDAARDVPCAPASAARWWATYRNEGLPGLLRNRRDDASIASIPASGGGFEVSSAPERTDPQQTEADGTERAQNEALAIQSRLIELLHRLPIDLPVGDWCREMRDVLQSAFADVDRVTISVNANCDLLHPEEYNPRLAIAQDAYPDDVHKGLGINRHDVTKTDVAEELISEFTRQGYPVDRYHPPFFLNLEYRGAYLGTVFLWCEKAGPQLSQRTIETFFQLKPFLVFAMSDVILRHHYTVPVERVFYSTLRQVASQAMLTPQEHRVITYRLLGYMYKEIAAELGISQDGVKKTLQQIYRKTGTGSHIEFFAKYFAPRIVPSRPAGTEATL